ncbi:GNAT family N-acetyltransferase [Gemella sp. GL1.1]|nr:GNAT family N-acetyltransferase [Gemella sp. GL1.1]MBF0746942.1 GNAT family N-acetyltransferase [Gemella sp. 19428wG2_WT2a]NYS26983.1 GNAT family N-acetyltransferase [Gemella sp. GL1]TFU59191.1 N-acetyltransferase [Gemella sp. WT2a]
MIRNAKKNDIDVLQGLYKFIQSLDIDLIKKIGNEKFFKILQECYTSEKDRFSYKNCRVLEMDSVIKGFYFSYEYDFMIESKEYWEKFIVSRYDLNIDDVIFEYNEALRGEYYLDTLYVFKEGRSQGLGSKLLEDFFKKEYNLLSLNVDKNNVGAKKLYESFGMKKEAEIMIANHFYDHMVLKK